MPHGLFVNAAYNEQLTFTDRDDDSAIDLSGATLGMKWWSEARSTPIVLTEGSGITVTDAADGIIIITLTPAQTTELGAGPVRAILYTNYTNETTRDVLVEGSGVIEAETFDA
jgi:hypothetical protein